jgi:hypothetical protein
MNFSTNILNKHIAAVHSKASFSMVQHKAINLLIKNAENKIDHDINHVLSIKSLLQGLGWASSSNSTELIRACLEGLVKTTIEWNILSRDKKNKWTISTLLASASIKGGEVFYTFSLPLRSLLKNPNLYARLDLNVQKLFNSKHSMPLWEYISGELSSKKVNSITTEWLSYSDFLKLNNLENSIYINRYALFLERVVEKSINEINEVSDLHASYEVLSERKKVTHIRFMAQKKMIPLIEIGEGETEECRDDSLIKSLSSIGLSLTYIDEILENQSEKSIKNALDFCESELAVPDNTIKNPVAYFKKALREEWVLPETVKNRLETNTCLQKGESCFERIENLEESESCKSFRKAVLKQLGETLYISWIEPARLKEENGQLIFESSRFNCDWVESRYAQEFKQPMKLIFQPELEIA